MFRLLLFRLECRFSLSKWCWLVWLRNRLFIPLWKCRLFAFFGLNGIPIGPAEWWFLNARRLPPVGAWFSLFEPDLMRLCMDEEFELYLLSRLSISICECVMLVYDQTLSCFSIWLVDDVATLLTALQIIELFSSTIFFRTNATQNNDLYCAIDSLSMLWTRSVLFHSRQEWKVNKW